jgi:nucleotide-binding universal stress UspA family protein
MSYKTVLVHLDTSERCAVRGKMGIDLARSYGAHLVGLTIMAPLAIPGSARTELIIRMLTEQWEKDRSQLVAVGAMFPDRARAAGVGEAEHRAALGEPERVLCVHARYADLLIIGQPDPEQKGMAWSTSEHVVLDAGRPVLVIPYTGECSTFAKRVLVAWNASREATRALTDALPLLQTANQVDVVTVNAQPEQSGHGEQPGADIALFLARHGVRANVHPTYGEDIAVGEWLLSRAADLGSDLIVMGAYGHSRVREMVLGGATRTLLRSMTVPVLMSH